VLSKNQTEEELVKVVARVMEREGKVLIARRGVHDKLACKWEFPGGKIEPGFRRHILIRAVTRRTVIRKFSMKNLNPYLFIH
jgi:ADP-ribose pyrophosphatase YjhB (NUDIX family)